MKQLISDCPVKMQKRPAIFATVSPAAHRKAMPPSYRNAAETLALISSSQRNDAMVG